MEEMFAVTPHPPHKAAQPSLVFIQYFEEGIFFKKKMHTSLLWIVPGIFCIKSLRPQPFLGQAGGGCQALLLAHAGLSAAHPAVLLAKGRCDDAHPAKTLTRLCRSNMSRPFRPTPAKLVCIPKLIPCQHLSML